jgi:hypothetical protein
MAAQGLSLAEPVKIAKVFDYEDIETVIARFVIALFRMFSPGIRFRNSTILDGLQTGCYG